MNRRTFLKTTGTVSAGLGAISVSGYSLAEMDCYVKRLPGVQLFTVRDALAADADAALGALARAGVREVELYDLSAKDTILGMPLLAFKTLLDKHELQATFSHFNAENIDVPAIARNARLLGVDTAILASAPGLISFGPDGLRAQGPRTKEDMDKLADLLNKLGRDFRREGLYFGYHNHHVEFIPVGNDIPYDYVMWNTDPQFVRSELDIGWIALAGMDYVDYLWRFGNRTLACHLKDFNGIRPADFGNFLDSASHLLPPGQGIVDFTEVLEHMDYFGIEHGFVEIDQSEDPMKAIAAGQQHLDSLRSC